MYRVTDPDRDEQMEMPGAFPFTRGIYPNMYREKLWTMRQYAGFGSAEQTNRRFRYLLANGQHGLSCAFDLPTQMGYDSDDPMAKGEVGKVGVAIDTLEDMERLFADIPLDRISTSMTINASAIVLLAMYVVVAERQGVSLDDLSGTVQNDILKEYVARGTYIYPPQPSMRLVTDVVAYCTEHIPKFKPISISGYHMREAGATAAQEIAFTLANGLAYVQAARNDGLAVDRFAPQLSFFFGVQNHFLEEVAKFRAARRLWAHLMRHDIGAENPRSWKMRIHAQTAGSALTAQQPENNVARVTMQALAAVLGGTQSLHTNAWDEAHRLPSEEAAQTALRTQQIIAYESGVTDTIDPLAGSYYIEQATDSLERKIRRYMTYVADLGGAIKAVENHFMKREIEREAYVYHRQVESGETVVVGLNRYNHSKPEQFAPFHYDQALERQQIDKLNRFRDQRKECHVQQTLGELRSAANGADHLMPFVIDAVKAGATVGEVCKAMRNVFGTYQPDDSV